jgi:GWxTD domain-containing protein
MLKKNLFSKVAFTVCIGLISVLGLVAQKSTPTPSTDVSDKVRKVKSELKEAYKNWLEKDVSYIITPEEKKAFKQLQTDEERENFIDTFWRRRDPDPDTEENEYREEYYERIAYANERFTSGIPGWKTDRGRIYISFGKPDSIESHPTGGSYDRPTHEGGGSTTTYPFEIWFYRHIDGVGDGIEIEFVDPTGSGEYRIARDANEKDALLYTPGAGQTLGEQLGTDNRADRISGQNRNNATYLREQDQPFRKLEILSQLQRPPQVKFTDLQGALTDSVLIDNNPLDFDLRLDFFRQSDERVITTFTVQAQNSELVFENVGGLETARMNIFGRITAVSGKRSGIFEDSVTASGTIAEVTQMKDRASIYQKAIALTPGTYKVDVVVRDVKSGNRGLRQIGFTVPKYDPEKLSASTLILASRLYTTDERDIGGRFVIGDKKVVPNLKGVYKKGQEVGIYLQVYNAGIDQITLRPSVDVDYVLVKDGKEIFKQKEDWSSLSDSGQRLTLARLLPTAGIPLGDYELKVKIKDRVPNAKGELQVIETSGKFSITN